MSTHWTAKQRNHLRRLIRQDATICYWCSDSHGRSANSRIRFEAGAWYDPHFVDKWTVRSGLVQEADDLRQLHGTMEPHRWLGSRVWVVGLIGEVQKIGLDFSARRREIIGEVMPEIALSESVGVRLGRKDLSRANLAGAFLRWMDLERANLDGADLTDAILAGANLDDAHLENANLTGANFNGANLPRARLQRANLKGACFYGSDLTMANLDGAILDETNFDTANLMGVKFNPTKTPPKGWVFGRSLYDGCCVLKKAPGGHDDG